MESLSVFPLAGHLCGVMMNSVIPNAAINDTELVSASLAGDRDAFGQIVARYQSLICSLAYSATGSLGQSEDLAQETFVAAWKKLGELREPEKLRAWLCGIARNLINNSLRKQGREPSHAAESMETILESHSPEPQPNEHTITNEEQAILWRSLERIPELYRDPLVLYYRENQSVEAVAEKLELNTDAVHQRLSRGRKLLHEEVLAFVEGALAKTNPGQAFTLGVLAALPITLASSAKAATVAAAAKGGAAATGTSFASVVLGILSGPALGFLFGFLGWREGLKNTRTPRERTSAKRFGLIILAGGILFFLACSLVSDYFAPRFWKHHPVVVLILIWAVALAWVIFAFGFTWRYSRTMKRLREEEQQRHPELFRAKPPLETFEYRSRATLCGLPLVHWCSFGKMRRPGEKVQPAIGWIACGERAYGILYASGGIAVGGISNGALSIGLLSFGGLSIGLLAFGGFALGAVALGGGAIGWVASGGMALGWHAALGGMVAAHDLACGGAALGNHVNDAVARGFFLRHRWLDFTQAGPRNLFWVLCFGPMSVQMMIWMWWRRKMEKRAKKINHFAMHNLKLRISLATVMALQLCVTLADPISDRITVTVRGNGPDVLLIPGLASSSAVWDATAKQLENRFRLHIIQVAGFAGAPARGNATGAVLQPTVDAIDLYIKTYQLKSPKIIGHSLGGLAGLMLAVQHPEDVGKLMVVDSLPFFSVLTGANDIATATPQAAAMRDYTLAESPEAYAQGERQFLSSLVKSPAGRKAVIGWAIASDKSVVARAMYEDMTTDLRPDLQKIKSPVTVLYPWDAASGFPHAAT